jgi:hypothetical protein
MLRLLLFMHVSSHEPTLDTVGGEGRYQAWVARQMFLA